MLLFYNVGLRNFSTPFGYYKAHLQKKEVLDDVKNHTDETCKTVDVVQMFEN